MASHGLSWPLMASFNSIASLVIQSNVIVLGRIMKSICTTGGFFVEYNTNISFLDADDTPWVKLTTVGNQRDSQVLAHTENDSCHVMTDYLSRFCLVGQSANQLGAVKALYLLIFGKPRYKMSKITIFGHMH